MVKGPNFHVLKKVKILKLRYLKSRKIIPYLYVVLAGTTKNKPKMCENLKSRNLKPDRILLYVTF